MNRRTTLIAPIVALGGLALPALFKADLALADTGAGSPDAVKLPPGPYKNRLLSYGTLSLKTSQIAAKVSTNPLVVNFALHEANEQVATAQSLTKMASPPPAPLHGEQLAQLAQVEQATPETIDSVYLAVQLAGHKRLHAFTTGYLSGTPDYTSDLTHITLISHSYIQQHLDLINQLIAEIS